MPWIAATGRSTALMRSLQTTLLALAAVAVLGTATASAEDADWRVGLSLIGTPKYQAGFTRFDYVNPDAPKGGTLRLAEVGGFDSLNPILPKGNPGPGLALITETLMTPSMDEVSTEYGLLAEAVKYPADYSSVTYRLRAEARWNDGQPVTVDDVIWSFNTTTKLNPNVGAYYSHVKKIEKTGEREVTFTFDAPGNRELPQIIGQLTVLPQHYWEGNDANGNKRDINKTTLEPPLGSGPYRIKSVVPSRNVVYERVPDYWGEKLNVNVGSNNFDQIRFESYLDDTVQIEAFKGDQFDWRVESSAKNWATAYDFPAKQQGRVIIEAIPDQARGVMQAFVVNLRRDKFKDPRVRQALNYAFDFESLNRTAFFGQYKRDNSFFAGTELASSGLPQGKELEILESVRGMVPEEVFTTEYTNPVGGDPTRLRDNFKKAIDLLAAAGWSFKGSKLVNDKTGEPFTFEYLFADPNFERVVLPYQRSLARIGITMTIRSVDQPQYQARLRSFDYDMITFTWPESLSPGNEQRYFWGSQTADAPTSYNFAGIKDPAVDKLIDRIIYATDRDDLVAATRALDRVLLWNHFVVPQWYYAADRIARWDRFGHPDPLPKYSVGFPTIWWWDAERAAKTGSTK
jgi:microcin C transport system substrate-binding protein